MATATQWAVTQIAHPEVRDWRPACEECLAQVQPAITAARATGSTGATHTQSAYEDGVLVEHSATVARAIKVVTG